MPKDLMKLPAPGRLFLHASPGSLQFPPAALPGCCQAPSERLLAALPPWLAAPPASLYMYKLPINRIAAVILLL